MKAMERRIKNIEDMLHVGRSEKKVFVVVRTHHINPLPEPIEEWITYKEAEANCGQFTVFVANQDKELEARENLQRAERAQ